jgi:O-antigen ligase
MRYMLEERVWRAADAGGRHPIRPLVLTVLLLAGFIGVLLFLALVVAPWAGAAGGCGGG